MEPTKHITDSAQDIRLSQEASSRIRARLLTHMRENPVQAAPVHSPYQRLFIRSPFMALLRKPAAALLIIVLVSLGGASTYAAAGALPGEPLYAVKVNVIEPVKRTLAITSEAKATVNASIALTRVKEVEALAIKEQLTPEKGSKSQSDFDQSLVKARVTIEKLSEKNPEAATKLEAAFSASLDEHEIRLNTFGDAASSTNATEARSFANHIKNRTKGKVQGAFDDKEDKRESPRKDKETSDDDDGIDLPVATTTASTTVETATSSEDILPETRRSGRGFLRSLDL